MPSRRDALKTLLGAGAFAPALFSARAAAIASLKEAYKGAFLIGAELSPEQFKDEDSRAMALIRAQFNTVTPGNCLKWDAVHPAPDRYDFSLPDRFVDYAEENGMFPVGHVLVWHNQTPGWVYQNAMGLPLGRDALLERLREHIHRVVGRYKGRIKAWDVVNEALEDDGSIRRTPWRMLLGEECIAQAFRFAHEADPAAELLYNEYSLEVPAKRAGAVALIKRLKAADVPVTTVGIQAHALIDWPPPGALDEAISDLKSLGVKVAITELDIDVLPRPSGAGSADINLRFAGDPAYDPYVGGLPDAMQQRLARHYAEVFATCLKHRDAVDRITMWGVTDAESWLNDWPIRGRTNYGLLFDREGKPKPAFHAVIDAAKGA